MDGEHRCMPLLGGVGTLRFDEVLGACTNEPADSG